MRLLEAACAPTIWAIRPESLSAILAMIQREDISREVIAQAFHYNRDRQTEAIDAVSTRGGTRLENAERVSVRDGVACIGVVGPIVRYGGLFSSLSGAASVEGLAKDLQVAIDDPNVKAVLLHIDSPGGEASGVAEMADIILAARERKPVWSYVSDLGASAAYWLASATEQIVVAQTAALGSIGCVAAFRKAKGADEIIEFVSSVSPNKRPDLDTDEGKAQIQSLVDTLGQIFVDAVARNRGVTAKTVIADFGAGGLLVGQDAVSAGLADRLGSYEATLRDLASAAPSTPSLSARPVQPRSVDAPRRVAELRTGPQTRFRMDRLDRFFAWLDGAGGATPTASADPEVAIVVQNLPTDPPVTAATGTPAGDDSNILIRLRAVEAENAKLRAQGIAREAGVFVAGLVTDLKVMPAAADPLQALVTQLMTDDQAGPIKAAGGTDTSRVALLANFFARVESRQALTGALLDPLTLRALSDRAAAEKLAPSDEPSTERMDSLIGSVPMGVTIITERNKNGAGATR